MATRCWQQVLCILILVTAASLFVAPAVEAQTSTPLPALPDLVVVAGASAEPATAGEPLVYTFTVRNQGAALAPRSQVQGGIPAGTSFVSASPACTLAGSLVGCPVPPLAPGGTATFALTVLVGLGTSTVFASFVADQENAVVESDESNNLAQVVTTVRQPTATPSPSATGSPGPSPTATLSPTPTRTPTATSPMSGPNEPPPALTPTPTSAVVPGTPDPVRPTDPTPAPTAALPTPPALPAGVLWLQVVTPTPIFSVVMDVLYTASAGTWYVVVHEEDSWALAVAESDPPSWVVWMQVDARVAPQIVDRPLPQEPQGAAPR